MTAVNFSESFQTIQELVKEAAVDRLYRRWMAALGK